MGSLLSWGKHHISIILTTALTVIIIALEFSPVVAATFTVNSTDQYDDANLGDGVCATNNGNCTFRAAIQEHNAIGETNTIILPSNTYMLLLEPKPRVYTGTLTIIGSGAATTIIDGGGFDTVLEVESASMNISGVTVKNGGDGGLSVWHGASLNLNSCVITENSASVGGGINNIGGSLVISNSTISHNSATFWGGGIFNSGNLSLSNSTINNNTAPDVAGILNGSALWEGGGSVGTASLMNVTISGNTAANTVGGLGNDIDATMSLTNTTISNNSAASGVGIYNLGTVTLRNTIIANISQSGNCAGPATITSAGYNISSDNTCNLGAMGDKSGIDPKLAALSNNGGVTWTHALLEESPAIDAGDPNAFPATDQRGITRPQGRSSDIGAYEFVPVISVPPTSVPTMTEWGMIIFAFLAGLGAVYNLKRQKA